MITSETIDILAKKIENVNTDAQFTEVGQIVRVYDGVAIVYGLNNVGFNEIVEFEDGTLGVVFSIEEDNIEIVVLGSDHKICEGGLVKRKGNTFRVPVGMGMLGRVVDTFGSPIDGKGPLENCELTEVDVKAPGIIDRKSVHESMQTGIKIIDALIPIGRGQRELIIGDRQTGKTSIAIDAILNQKETNKQITKAQKLFCIYVAIGQKKSSVARIVKKLEESGAMDYSVVVVAGASDPAPLQFYVPYVGCAIGEYFRNNGMHSLVVYDDLSKHAVAYREISLLLRRPPGREAYPGDIFYVHSRLLERAARLSDELGGGSLTALPIIETQEGDVSAYIPTNVISITDGQIFVESELFYQGIKPAINVGLSVSRVGSAAQIKAMKQVAGTIKLDLAQFREMQSFSQFASDLDVATRKQLEKGERMTELMKQQLHTPMPIEEQVLVIFAAVNDFIQAIPLKKISHFEKCLLTYVKKENPEILREIREKKILSTELKTTIVNSITSFIKIFT
jgi:F-type H+-transporting ATPase subunit alpha